MFLRAFFRNRAFGRTAIVPALFLSVFVAANAQQAVSPQICLSAEDIKSLSAGLDSPAKAFFDKQLEQEILALGVSVSPKEPPPQLAKKIPVVKPEEKPLIVDDQICALLKTHGWITNSLAGEQGTGGFLFLLKNNTSAGIQRALLPLVVKAAERGELKRDVLLASYIDNVRVRAGFKQWFGTQAVEREGFLYLLPIENESKVDERRTVYGMESLRDYLRYLERKMGMPLLRSERFVDVGLGMQFRDLLAKPTPDAAAVSGGDKTTGDKTGSDKTGDDEVIKVDSTVVNIDANVYNEDRKIPVATLEQKDFHVLEDGVAQDAVFFSKTESPFDLVLLLDMSGSTSEKTKLIRRTTRKFIEAARPVDRIAIVTFAFENKIVSGFSSNKQELLASTENIKDNGGSRIWDALKFTLDDMFPPKTPGRRRAVVLMTDGVDNALLGEFGYASQTSFSELMDSVLRSDTSIVPIYLDTEPERPGQTSAYALGRKTLHFLADESGGFYYYARKLEDLNGVYRQVLQDLGRVYSIGYTPKNQDRSGQWRTIKVEVPAQPTLKVRTRSGYYAK
jgi:VWFA-related protein